MKNLKIYASDFKKKLALMVGLTLAMTACGQKEEKQYDEGSMQQTSIVSEYEETTKNECYNKSGKYGLHVVPWLFLVWYNS